MKRSMTKRRKIELLIIIVGAFCLLIAFCVDSYRKNNQVVVTYINDETTHNTNILYNNDIYYWIGQIGNYQKGKRLGRTGSHWYSNDVYTIKYDENLEYLCIPDWDGKSLYSKIIPLVTTGQTVTSVYLGHYADKCLTNRNDIDFLLALGNITGESYSYQIGSGTVSSTPIYLCYDNNPVSTEYLGYISHTTDNKWIYVPKNQIVYDYSSSRTGTLITDSGITSELRRITMDVPYFK